MKKETKEKEVVKKNEKIIEDAKKVLDKIDKEDFKDIYAQIKKWIADEHDFKNLLKALICIDTDVDSREKLNKDDINMALDETVKMIMSKDDMELPVLNEEILDFFENTLYDFTKERELNVVVEEE